MQFHDFFICLILLFAAGVWGRTPGRSGSAFMASLLCCTSKRSAQTSWASVCPCSGIRAPIHHSEAPGHGGPCSEYYCRPVGALSLSGVLAQCVLRRRGMPWLIAERLSAFCVRALLLTGPYVLLDPLAQTAILFESM